MDQGESGALPRRSARDGVAIELAGQAGLTDRAGGTLGADGEALDKLLVDHRAQVIEIDMGAALVPQGKVLVAGGRGGHGRLGLGEGVAQEVADVVLVDLGLEAQRPLVVEEHRRRRELNRVALLPGEVENRQEVAGQGRDMEDVVQDDGRGQNSVHLSRLEHHRAHTRRVDDVGVGEANGDVVLAAVALRTSQWPVSSSVKSILQETKVCYSPVSSSVKSKDTEPDRGVDTAHGARAR